MEQMNNNSRYQNTMLETQTTRQINTYTVPSVNLSSLNSVRQVSTTVSSKSERTNLIGKVRIVALVSIILLLGFLLIYNQIAIGALSTSIVATEAAIAQRQDDVDVLKAKLNELNNEENIMQRVADAGYTNSYSNTIDTNIDVQEVVTPAYETQTNWFDSICNFFSGLFGG